MNEEETSMDESVSDESPSAHAEPAGLYGCVFSPDCQSTFTAFRHGLVDRAGSPHMSDEDTTTNTNAAAVLARGTPGGEVGTRGRPLRRKRRVRGKVTMCGVCGDQAISHNFGAITCETCKAFFRRNAHKHKELPPCAFNNDCTITKVTRRFCALCRLKKCYAIGMDPLLILDDEERKARQARRQLKKQQRCQQSAQSGGDTVASHPPTPSPSGSETVSCQPPTPSPSLLSISVTPVASGPSPPAGTFPITITCGGPVVTTPLAVTCGGPVVTTPLAVTCGDPVLTTPLAVTCGGPVVTTPLAVTRGGPVVTTPLAVACGGPVVTTADVDRRASESGDCHELRAGASELTSLASRDTSLLACETATGGEFRPWDRGNVGLICKAPAVPRAVGILRTAMAAAERKTAPCAGLVSTTASASLSYTCSPPVCCDAMPAPSVSENIPEPVAFTQSHDQVHPGDGVSVPIRAVQKDDHVHDSVEVLDSPGNLRSLSRAAITLNEAVSPVLAREAPGGASGFVNEATLSADTLATTDAPLSPISAAVNCLFDDIVASPCSLKSPAVQALEDQQEGKAGHCTAATSTEEQQAASLNHAMFFAQCSDVQYSLPPPLPATDNDADAEDVSYLFGVLKHCQGRHFQHVLGDELPDDASMYWQLSEEERVTLAIVTSAYNHTILSVTMPPGWTRHRTINIDTMHNILDMSFHQSVSFAKIVPEFKQLRQSDQIATLKASALQTYCVRVAAVFDPDRRLWRSMTGETSTATAARLLSAIEGGMTCLPHIASYSEALKSVVRNDVTLLALLHCVLLFDPRYPKLEQRALVNRQRDAYLLLLKHHLESRFSFLHADRYMSELMANLLDVQEVGRVMTAFYKRHPGFFRPLVAELLTD